MARVYRYDQDNMIANLDWKIQKEKEQAAKIEKKIQLLVPKEYVSAETLESIGFKKKEYKAPLPKEEKISIWNKLLFG